MNNINIYKKTFNIKTKTHNNEIICAIGDIHGNFRLMENLVNYLNKEYPKSRLIFLGDLVTRGYDSASCLLYAWDLSFNKKLDFSRVDYLIGNHEQMLFSPLVNKNFPRYYPWWPNHYLTNHWLDNYISNDLSPEESLKNCLIDSSYGFLIGENECINLYNKWIDYAFRPFLNKNIITKDSPLFKMSGNVVFVHAGVNPNINLIKQFKKINLLDFKGNIKNSPLWMDNSFLNKIENKKPYYKNKEYFVVHGHSIVKSKLSNGFINLKPDGNRIGIDSGAYNSGILSSAVILDNKIEIIQMKENN